MKLPGFDYFWKQGDSRAFWSERRAEIRFFAKVAAPPSGRAVYHRRWNRPDAVRQDIIVRERRVHSMPQASLFAMCGGGGGLPLSLPLGPEAEATKTVDTFRITHRASKRCWDVDIASLVVALDYWRENLTVLPMCREEPPASKKTPERRAMTADELAMAFELRRCSFTPGSFDKRFSNGLYLDLSGAIPMGKITERQAALLPKLVTRYRRQIRPFGLPEHLRYLLTDEEARKQLDAEKERKRKAAQKWIDGLPRHEGMHADTGEAA